jgi:hypothetical protein
MMNLKHIVAVVYSLFTSGSATSQTLHVREVAEDGELLVALRVADSKLAGK